MNTWQETFHAFVLHHVINQTEAYKVIGPAQELIERADERLARHAEAAADRAVRIYNYSKRWHEKWSEQQALEASLRYRNKPESL